MNDRYLSFYKLQNNDCIFGENCPVNAVGRLLIDKQLKRIVGQLKFRNLSNDPISYISISIKGYDDNGNVIQNIDNFEYKDLHANFGDEFGSNIAIIFKSINIRRFSIRISQIIFENTKSWTDIGVEKANLDDTSSPNACTNENNLNYLEHDKSHIENENVLFCRNCNSEIPTDSVFCYICGSPVAVNNVLPAGETVKPQNKVSSDTKIKGKIYKLKNILNKPCFRIGQINLSPKHILTIVAIVAAILCAVFAVRSVTSEEYYFDMEQYNNCIEGYEDCLNNARTSSYYFKGFYEDLAEKWQELAESTLSRIWGARIKAIVFSVLAALCILFIYSVISKEYTDKKRIIGVAYNREINHTKRRK